MLAAANYFFFNDSLSTSDNIVIYLNMILAAYAGVLNYRASSIQIASFAKIRLATSVLCFIYVIGYIAVVFLDMPIMSWSQLFRGVSLTAWIVVWILPAILSLKMKRHLGEKD